MPTTKSSVTKLPVVREIVAPSTVTSPVNSAGVSTVSLTVMRMSPPIASASARCSVPSISVT